MTQVMIMPRGRPANVGPIDELEKERGRRVATWIRSGMMPPHQIVELSNRDVAKLIGKWPSAVGVWLNDCFDNHSQRMSFPAVETIRIIAEKLRLDADEGIGARYWVADAPKNKSDFGISGKIPDKHTSNYARILRQVFSLYEKHAYEGKIPDANMEKMIEYMLDSVEVHGTEAPEELADYNTKEGD